MGQLDGEPSGRVAGVGFQLVAALAAQGSVDLDRDPGDRRSASSSVIWFT
jgi:hypothetical protein